VKIVLVSTPQFKNTETFSPSYMDYTSAFNYPPLGLLYLASNLTGNHECKILDALALGYSPQDCLEEIKNYKPSVVGMTVFTDSLYSCFILTTKIKSFDPTIKIVLGGPHVNIYPEETARWSTVDYVLTGFSENSFACLIETLDKKRGNKNMTFEDIPGLWRANGTNVFKPNSCVDSSWDINKIKRPNRKLLNMERYFTVVNNKTTATMLSSRGCPFSCTFCDIFEKRYQERDVYDIVEELKEIMDLDISQVHFFDDCFNLKRDRVVEMCRAFIDNNLKLEWSFRGRVEPCDEELVKLLYKAGCRRAHLGIEGADQRTINRIKKKIEISEVPKILKIYNENGIETLGYFIIGFPFQSYEDCVVACKRMAQMGFDYIYMFILVPYPQTEIYKELLDKELLKKDYWHEHAVNPHPDFKLERWHPHIERKELEELLNKYYKRFYLSPKFIFSEFRRTRSLNSFIRKVKLASAMITSKFK
jgi:radical SAM superfamily enzyme YgiQ (UPF0313 family)